MFTEAITIHSQTNNQSNQARVRALIDKLKLSLIRYRSRQQLARLDDRMLRDIGISRFDAQAEVAKPFWKE